MGSNARAFPADTKLQSFYTEQFEKENATRLKFQLDRKRGIISEDQYILPAINKTNPMLFARNMVNQEKQRIAEIAEEARRTSHKQAMLEPDPKDLTKLYDGFTREGKGRGSYLKVRKQYGPEQKYTYPVLSSWQYGWQIGQTAEFNNPRHARTCVIRDSFYKPNGVPGLGMHRAYTTI